MFIKEFTIRILGEIIDSEDKHYVNFDTCLDLENVTSTLSIDKNEKPSIEFKFDNSYLWFNSDEVRSTKEFCGCFFLKIGRGTDTRVSFNRCQ